MSDANTFPRHKNSVDLLYYHAELGEAETPSATGERKSSMFFCGDVRAQTENFTQFRNINAPRRTVKW